MFRDVPESRWSHDDITEAVQAGLYRGFPDGTFRPTEPVTREQDVVVAMRLLRSIPSMTMIQRVMPSIVIIHHTIPGVGVGRGSGVWVADGKVVTNAHVVSYQNETGYVDVFGYEGDGISGDEGHGWSPYEGMRATVQAIDHSKDLALLDVDLPAYSQLITTKTVEFGPGVGRAERVWAIGIPLGFPWDVSDGIIRHPTRRINYWDVSQVVYAMTVPINPGNSGGGLFNYAGEYVGVPSAGVTGYNSLTFAIPIYQVRQFLRWAGYDF